MKADDKFKNIKPRSSKSLVDQLLSTAERSDYHKTDDQLRQQLRECAVLAFELKKRMESGEMG